MIDFLVYDAFANWHVEINYQYGLLAWVLGLLSVVHSRILFPVLISDFVSYAWVDCPAIFRASMGPNILVYCT